MKKFMKKLAKKSEGFTLVELVVVIAILGILAGVAVPAYTGYIKKANDAAVITELDALKTAVRTANATGSEVTGLEINAGGTTVVITADTLASNFINDFNLFYGGTNTLSGKTVTLGSAISFTNTSYANGVEWASNTWTPVAATED